MMRADELTVVIAFRDRDVPINYSNVRYDLHRGDGVTVVHDDGRREHHGGEVVVDVQTFTRAAPAA
jgi:hypothetical protein